MFYFISWFSKKCSKFRLFSIFRKIFPWRKFFLRKFLNFVFFFNFEMPRNFQEKNWCFQFSKFFVYTQFYHSDRKCYWFRIGRRNSIWKCRQFTHGKNDGCRVYYRPGWWNYSGKWIRNFNIFWIKSRKSVWRRKTELFLYLFILYIRPMYDQYNFCQHGSQVQLHPNSPGGGRV